MDGRSIVQLLVDPADPNVLPATRQHILREREAIARSSSTSDR
jgi:hypothetical protein